MKKLMMSAALTLMALTTTGCGKEQGPAGPPGTSGAIKATINCSGTIASVSGLASILNGLEVRYSAVLTHAGDVYASASVADEASQVSGTAFYAAAQTGAQNGRVSMIADYYGTANWGYWEITLDRNTLVTTAVYTDSSLGFQSPVVMNFAANACTVQSW
jgi:hypothetical protein